MLPLLRRIREEGALLAAFDDLMHQGVQLVGPPLASAIRVRASSVAAGALADSFRQNLSERDTPVYMPARAAQPPEAVRLPLPAAYYADKLAASLPVPDYFVWCASEATAQDERPLQETFLALASTAFAYPDRFCVQPTFSQSSVVVGQFRYHTPVLAISSAE